MISYAQAREDVFLWRALAPRVHHSVGFWIDVGAYDPVQDSVTKEFSRHGWRGINIEPIEPYFLRFLDDRPDDINIRALVSDHDGEGVFYEVVGHQLSTMESRFADRHARSGFPMREHVLPTLTLTRICEQHAPGQIHFLKVDVEGHEARVLAGMDFSRFRPWLLIIEATEPNDLDTPTHQEWERTVFGAGYEHVHTHLPNRYYIAREHPELRPAFSLPVDDYVLERDLQRIRTLEHELEEARARIAQLESRPVA
jgi:FkbM family methyltransferase